jgi:hypothetical protein
MDLIDCIGAFLVSATPLKPLNGVDETCTSEQQHMKIVHDDIFLL